LHRDIVPALLVALEMGRPQGIGEGKLRVVSCRVRGGRSSESLGRVPHACLIFESDTVPT
jgi:hypothetical protein